MEEEIKKLEEEFDNTFTPDWWKGFGTNDDIDKQGIVGIKSFLTQKLQEAYSHRTQELQGLMDELKEKWEIDIDKELETEHSLVPLSDVLSLIKSKLQ